MKQAMKDKISTIALQTAITFLKGITSLIQDEANKRVISVDEFPLNAPNRSTSTNPCIVPQTTSKN